MRIRDMDSSRQTGVDCNFWPDFFGCGLRLLAIPGKLSQPACRRRAPGDWGGDVG